MCVSALCSQPLLHFGLRDYTLSPTAAAWIIPRVLRVRCTVCAVCVLSPLSLSSSSDLPTTTTFHATTIHRRHTQLFGSSRLVSFRLVSFRLVVSASSLCFATTHLSHRHQARHTHSLTLSGIQHAAQLQHRRPTTEHTTSNLISTPLNRPLASSLQHSTSSLLALTITFAFQHLSISSASPHHHRELNTFRTAPPTRWPSHHCCLHRPSPTPHLPSKPNHSFHACTPALISSPFFPLASATSACSGNDHSPRLCASSDCTSQYSFP